MQRARSAAVSPRSISIVTSTPHCSYVTSLSDVPAISRSIAMLSMAQDALDEVADAFVDDEIGHAVQRRAWGRR